jgi:hypothetical protein
MQKFHTEFKNLNRGRKMTTHSTHFTKRPRAFGSVGILVDDRVRGDVPRQFIRVQAVIQRCKAIRPFYGILMLLCGLFSGAVGLVGITYEHECSWLVWRTLVPTAWALCMVIGE